MDVDELGAAAALRAFGRLRAERDRADRDIFRLAAHFADLYHAEATPTGLRQRRGGERAVQVAGEGAPLVLEFAIAEMSAELHITTWSARRLIGDALETRHRLPRLWARVEAGEVAAWLAGKVARATRDLTPAQAGTVDNEIAEYADGRLPYWRFAELLTAKVAAADPDATAERERLAAEERFAKVSRTNDHGQKTLYVKTTAAEMTRIDATITLLADALKALGDTDHLDLRRAKATLVMANPLQAITLLQALATHRANKPTSGDDTGSKGSSAGSDGSEGRADDNGEGSDGSEGGSGKGGSARSTDGNGRGEGSSEGAGDPSVGTNDGPGENPQPADGAPTRNGPEEHPDPDLEGRGPRPRPRSGHGSQPRHAGSRLATVSRDDVPPGTDPAHRHEPKESPPDLLPGCDPPGDPQEDGMPPEDDPPGPVDAYLTPFNTADVPPCACRGGTMPLDWATLLPTAHLYLHVHRDSIDTGTGIARWEGVGPVTLRYIQEFLGPYCRFLVKPVIDPATLAPVDAYEIPDRQREALHLRTPADVFPYAPNTSRGQQADHTKPYRPPDEGGARGQTGLHNLGPMTTYHHRVKTHAGWHLEQPIPGIYLWIAPHGSIFLVDHTGTRQLRGPQVPAADRPSPLETRLVNLLGHAA